MEIERKETKSQQFYIECLKQDISKAVNRSIDTYTDFNYLSLQMKEKMNDASSVSTLKRMWNYVSDNSQRSRTTLNILARFIDYRDWSDYVEHLMRENRVESHFIDARTIVSASLVPGDIIELEWNPDRRATLIYKGDSWFQVLKSENATIKGGMEVSAAVFSKGLPLACAEVKNGDENLGTYIAGSRNGLTSLRLVPHADKG